MKELFLSDSVVAYIYDLLKGKENAQAKAFLEKVDELEKEEKATPYYKTFWGHKVSDYALRHGLLDYATFSKCFDCVLCNYITSLDDFYECEVVSGSLEYYTHEGEEITEEQAAELEEEGEDIDVNYRDFFQFYIVSPNGLDLLKEAGETVLYYDKLDIYIWCVDHWGTSWDYVLTSIPLRRKDQDR